jgi:hypothetical protein
MAGSSICLFVESMHVAHKEGKIILTVSYNYVGVSWVESRSRWRNHTHETSLSSESCLGYVRFAHLSALDQIFIVFGGGGGGVCYVSFGCLRVLQSFTKLYVAP